MQNTEQDESSGAFNANKLLVAAKMKYANEMINYLIFHGSDEKRRVLLLHTQ